MLFFNGVQFKSRHIKLSSIFIFCVLTLISCKEDNPANVAGEVINAFSDSCSSSGKWSQGAQAQTQSLIGIFNKLKEVDACKGLASVLNDVSQTATQIHGIYSDPSYLAYRQVEEELQQLTLTLASATDPSVQVEISALITAKQVELAKARAQKNIDDTNKNTIGFQDQYSKANQALGTQFVNLFNHTSELSACLQQSPSSVVSLFSNLSSVAGSFASPVLGANMQVLSGMMTTFLGYMRASHIDKAIWDLYDSQMPQALTCGLESMTQFYCQAEDASELVMRQADNFKEVNSKRDNEFWSGIELISKKMPVLNGWLLSVRAGVKPRNDDDATRINRVREKRLRLDTFSTKVIGNLNNAKSRMSQTTDAHTKEDIKYSAVGYLASILSGSDSTQGAINPFQEFQSSTSRTACFLIKGVNFACPDIGYTEGLRSYLEKLGLELVSIDEIQNIFWPQILERVTRKVSAEFNDIIFIDPNLLLSQVYEHTPKSVSPMDVLKGIKIFLANHLQRSQQKYPHRVHMIQETIDILDHVITSIDNYIQNPDADTLNPLIDINEVLKLEFGTQFIGERIGEFVRADINDRIDNGEVPKDLEEILRAANDEVIHRLTASGNTDLFLIKRDLDRAREQSADNFRVFRDFMLEAAGKAIQGLQKKSIESGETLVDGGRRIYGQSVAHLCLLVYATGDKWPDQATQNICNQSVLFSVYPDPASERKLVLSELPAKLSQYNDRPMIKNRKRICSYYNFLRAEHLYEIMLPINQNAKFNGAAAENGWLQSVSRDKQVISPKTIHKVNPIKPHQFEEAEFFQNLIF
jgi:hypothetical protein